MQSNIPRSRTVSKTSMRSLNDLTLDSLVSALKWFLLMEVSCLCGPSPYEAAQTLQGALSNQELFNITGESNLDLEYAMNLVTPAQNVTLYQVGDLVVGPNLDHT